MDHQLDHYIVWRPKMRVSVTDAKAQLTELVRRAEAGEEIIITRHDTPVVEMRAVRRQTTPEEREKILREFQEAAARYILPGPDAAHSADFLYDEDGLPK
jgi:prevent-host-death family protein